MKRNILVFVNLVFLFLLYYHVRSQNSTISIDLTDSQDLKRSGGVILDQIEIPKLNNSLLPHTQSGERILFLGNFQFNLDNTSETGASNFRNFLTTHGYSYTVQSTPPNPITISYLTPYSAVIFSNISRTLTTGEADVFQSYIESYGGNILLLGDLIGISSTNRNIIGNRFQITFNNDLFCDPNSHVYYDGNCSVVTGDPDHGVEYVLLSQFTSHPVTTGVSNFLLNWGQSISVSGSAQGVARGSSASWGDVNAVYQSKPECSDGWYINTNDANEVHNNLIGVAVNSISTGGKVVAIGDQSMLWNWCFPSYAQTLIANTFDWFFIPDLISPSNNYYLVDTSPYFEWSDISGVTRYNIQIDDNSNFSSPENYNPSGSRFIPEFFTEGTYYWRVRTITDSAYGKWSTVNIFHIMKKPILLSPTNNSQITDDTPSFLWSGLAYIYYFEIATTQTFQSGSIVTQIPVQDTTYQQSIALTRGQRYYWRIRPFGTGGDVGTTSDIYNFDLLSGTVSITITTSPSGRLFTVDSTAYTTSQTFSWVSGSSHTIGTTTPQAGGTGTQYVWSGWSDGGARSHTVAPTSNVTYTANFTTQYYLTMNAGTGGTVSPASSWRNAGVVVAISATANSGYTFSSWAGSGSGSYSGTTNNTTITMNGPVSETANFNQTLTANFSATPVFGFEPLTVVFSDLSIGEVVSWYWDFGDGSTSLLKEPTHTYTTYGIYNVSLRVTSQSAENQISKENYISVVKLNPPASPQPGNPVQVNISIPPNFNPTFSRLFYRRGGETEYNSLELPNSIPSDYVSVCGLEYYILMATGTDTIIYPNQEGKTHPEVIPVTMANYFPPDINIQAEKYDMISVPLELGSDKTISSLLGDDYGEYDQAQWRVFRYLNPPGSYVEYSAMNFALEPGMGFWLIIRGNSGFDVDGVSVNTGQVYSIELQPGANQIGNPFAFPVAWSRIENSDLVEIPQACIYYGTDNYEYMPRVTLEPWKGYFILNQNQSAVTLRVPPFESYGNESEDLAWRQVKGDEFVVQLKVQGMQSGKRDEQNFIGMLHAAKEGLDQIDFIEAPAIAAGLRLSIVDGTDRYSGNFTSISTSGVLWDIELGNSGSGEMGILEIVNSDPLPFNFKISLYDEDKRELSMVSEGRWMIEMPGKGEIRHLKVLIGTEQYKEDQENNILKGPQEFALYPNYPNPFNPSTTLRYQIIEDGQVRLEIFDLLGRKIKVLVNGYQNSGVHVTNWDGTDENRSVVPSGIYICRLVSQKQSSTQKVILIR